MKKIALFLTILVTISVGLAAKTEAPLSVNATAEILAGTATSVPASMQALYPRHKQQMDAMWQKIDANNIKMREWIAKNRIACNDDLTVIYPLSGGDFINVFNMYPKAERYIMFALEDAGIVPDFQQIGANQAALGLNALRNSVHNMATTNYFMSLTMAKEMHSSHVKGTLPVIMTFMARMGMTVNSVRLVYVKEDGFPADYTDEMKKAGKPHDGYIIRFRVAGETSDRLLMYLKMRVKEAMFKNDIKEARFLKTYSKFNVMLKSAVYLLPWHGFYDFREFLMERAEVIAQDDSGIAFDYLKKSGRNITLFGDYDRVTLSDRESTPYHADLKKEYETLKPGKLPFHFGYGMLKNKSTLIVARKKVCQ